MRTLVNKPCHLHSHIKCSQYSLPVSRESELIVNSWIGSIKLKWPTMNMAREIPWILIMKNLLCFVEIFSGKSRHSLLTSILMTMVVYFREGKIYFIIG